jgi:hypothetical protein
MMFFDMAILLTSAASVMLAAVLSRFCLAFLLWAIVAVERREARPQHTER